MAVGIYGGVCVETHSAYITDRGGRQRVAQLVDLTSVQWDRRRDQTSEAVITLRGAACSAQASILSQIEPKRSELVIFRGDQRVWEGPVNKVGWHADWVEIVARDVTDYLFGRPLSKEWNNRYPNTTTVTGRMDTIISDELATTFMYRDSVGNPVVLPGWEMLDPPANVLPYLVVHHFPNEARTSAKTEPFQMTVGEHLDNFARTGGIDYTTVGRAIHIWDVSRDLGQLRTMTEADFFGEIIVTAYGADHASVAFTVADDARYGGSGGVATDWKFLQKTAAAGTLVTLPPTSTSRRPSLVTAGSEGWNEYGFWMAYQKDSGATMRVAASKDATTWKDVAEADVDADSGAGVTVTPGNYPTLSFAYDDRLWLFWIGTDGHLYRSRSDDGVDWTTKVDLYTPTGGVTLASPSLFYNSTTERWVMFAVNTANGTVVYMTSTTKDLDGAGQWETLQTASIPGATGITSQEMHRVGARWVGMVHAGTSMKIVQSVTSRADSGFNASSGTMIPSTASGKYDTLGKPTWYQADDGQMVIWHGGQLAGAFKVLRTITTGPAPDIGTGDPSLDYYGPWTKVFTVYDEDDTSPPTQSDLNSQAKRNLSGRAPVPIEVRVPDNSGIRLSPGITLDTLVPGVHIPLLATLNARQVSQMQKLDKLTVSETPDDGELVQVVLIPATKPDDNEEEET